jgi:hypothetical protein
VKSKKVRRLGSSSVLLVDAGLAATRYRGGADGLPEHQHPVLLLRANNLFWAPQHKYQACEIQLRSFGAALFLTAVARLLARRVDGIHLAPFEQGEIGPDLFRHACLMGLEGLVSKHRESSYRAGRSPRWIKVKNRQHPAFSWVMDAFG